LDKVLLFLTSAAKFMIVTNQGNYVDIKVDCADLQSGFYFGTVKGYDATNSLLGPLFTIPITICKPFPPTPRLCFEHLKFSSGDIIRKFISVPIESNYAEICITMH
jgi:tripeptidyl-peptidase-2